MRHYWCASLSLAAWLSHSMLRDWNSWKKWLSSMISNPDAPIPTNPHVSDLCDRLSIVQYDFLLLQLPRSLCFWLTMIIWNTCRNYCRWFADDRLCGGLWFAKGISLRLRDLNVGIIFRSCESPFSSLFSLLAFPFGRIGLCTTR